MRRFYLNRKADKTGISGTGRVADGVVFEDGSVVMRWRGKSPTTVLHSSIESVRALHVEGHGAGANEIVWLDDDTRRRRKSGDWRHTHLLCPGSPGLIYEVYCGLLDPPRIEGSPKNTTCPECLFELERINARA